MLTDAAVARAATIRNHFDLVGLRIEYLSSSRVAPASGSRLRRRVVGLVKSVSAERVAAVAPLFDEDVYSAQVGERMSAAACAQHYLESGAASMLNPSFWFDSRWYEGRHPEWSAESRTPLEHYADVGWQRGNAASAYFDTRFYLSRYEDVRDGKNNPLIHFMDHGMLEGRRSAAHRPAANVAQWQINTLRDSMLFDEAFYAAALLAEDGETDDDAAIGADLIAHYLEGEHGLNPSAAFDTDYYLQQLPEVGLAEVNPLLHFITLGWRLGVSPDPDRTVERYLMDHGGVVDEYQPVTVSEDIDRQAGLIGLGYSSWHRVHTQQRPSDLAQMRVRAAEMSNPPTISVLLPVYNANPKHLRDAIQSVRDQAYPYWELCIADDASTDPKVGVVLRHAEQADERIKVVWRAENGNISASSNSALAAATGEFVALLDHDDLVAPDALFHYATSIVEDPEVDLIYSDEDSLDQFGNHGGQHFKSAWNEELFLRQNYINHLSAYRRSVVEAVGGFRLGFEGSQDHDLALRVVARSGGNRVRHIPRVLYSWRQFEGSGTFSQKNATQAELARQRAVRDYLEAVGRPATVKRGAGGFNAVSYTLASTPKVSILIPTKDQAPVLETCVRSVIEKTDYPNFEIIVVNNNSEEAETFALFDRLAATDRVTVIDYPHPFNYSAINNFAARHATGDLLNLLNNDVEVIESEWLTHMVAHAVRPEVGAVGAQLLYPDGRIQHSGVVVGLGWQDEGVAGHVHSFVERGAPGYFWRAQLTQAFSAVTAACLVVDRKKFDEVGGLDEVNLKVAFNDVNFCLDLREAGYTNIYVAEALLYHHESLSRGPDTEGPAFDRFKLETEFMEQKWGDTLRYDPYYNPNLNLDISKNPAFHGVAWPPRQRFARQFGRPSVAASSAGRLKTTASGE